MTHRRRTFKCRGGNGVVGLPARVSRSGSPYRRTLSQPRPELEGWCTRRQRSQDAELQDDQRVARTSGVTAALGWTVEPVFDASRRGVTKCEEAQTKSPWRPRPPEARSCSDPNSTAGRRPSVEHASTVDEQGLAADERAVVGQQKHGGAEHVCRLSSGASGFTLIPMTRVPGRGRASVPGRRPSRPLRRCEGALPHGNAH